MFLACIASQEECLTTHQNKEFHSDLLLWHLFLSSWNRVSFLKLAAMPQASDHDDPDQYIWFMWMRDLFAAESGCNGNGQILLGRKVQDNSTAHNERGREGERKGEEGRR